MIGYLPKRPEGNGPDAAFMRWVWDTLVQMLRPAEVPGMRVHRTTRGVSMIPEATGGAPGSGTGALSLFRFHSLTSVTISGVVYYYSICRTWNPVTATEGSLDINIAIPWRLQPPKIGGGGYPTEYIPGLGLVTYDYAHFLDAAGTGQFLQKRKAVCAGTGVTEYQFVTPPYIAADVADSLPPIVIAAATVPTGITVSGYPITLLEDSERVFAWDPYTTS
jgi:hypothetical protein